jgi:AraC family transcriptional activator of pobA
MKRSKQNIEEMNVKDEMTETFKIYTVEKEDAERIASTLNEPHYHEFEELIIGVEGQLEHFIDFETTIFEAPFISFVTKGKVHRVKPLLKDGKCKMWVIRFRSEFIAETTFQLYCYYHDKANLVLKADHCFKRLTLLCELMQGETKQESPDYSVIRHLLSALFTMIESERKKLEPASFQAIKTQSITFRNFLRVLEENFRRPEGVEYYAEKLFMSSRNLNLITQNILQQSVSEIIETRKLLEAKNLLISSDKTIAEIGFELGFNDKSYFTNVFKKKAGQTPTEFREEMRGLVS